MVQKNNLRTSSYINAVDVGDGSSLLYNGFTSRVDLVQSDIARRLTDGNGCRDFSFLSGEEAQYLVNRGHLTRLTVQNEREEFRKLAEHVLKVNERLGKRVTGRKAITFILTYKCNLSCDYCYQNEVRKKLSVPAMDEAFVDEFFRCYLTQLFPRHHRKNISFLLFGGEPLLPGNRGAIERILQYAEKYGSGVSAATNAVNVPRMLDLIGPEQGKINTLQVTLDGEKMFHDARRVPPSGAPTGAGAAAAAAAVAGGSTDSTASCPVARITGAGPAAVGRSAARADSVRRPRASSSAIASCSAI